MTKKVVSKLSKRAKLLRALRKKKNVPPTKINLTGALKLLGLPKVAINNRTARLKAARAIKTKLEKPKYAGAPEAGSQEDREKLFKFVSSGAPQSLLQNSLLPLLLLGGPSSAARALLQPPPPPPPPRGGPPPRNVIIGGVELPADQEQRALEYIHGIHQGYDQKEQKRLADEETARQKFEELGRQRAREESQLIQDYGKETKELLKRQLPTDRIRAYLITGQNAARYHYNHLLHPKRSDMLHLLKDSDFLKGARERAEAEVANRPKFAALRPKAATKPSAAAAATAAAPRGRGRGKKKEDDGLWNDQIDMIMSPVKAYQETVPRDMFPTKPVKWDQNGNACWVVNLSKQNEEGTHWVAILITPTSCEYCDSFADQAPDDIYKAILLNFACKKGSPIRKLKENLVIKQDARSDMCGWYACKFLQDRLINHKTFQEATGYKILRESIQDSEASIKRFQEKYPPFETIIRAKK